MNTITAEHPHTQRATAHGRILYRFEAQLTVRPVGLVPEGIRYANAFEGEIVEGIMKGARVSGVDPFLLRRDGVGIVDAPKALSLGDVNVYEHVRAYSVPPAGMELPPLEALLDPDFVWPDIAFPIYGFSVFQSGTPELAYLNRAIARVDGSANFVTGALEITTRLLEPNTA